MTWPQERSLVVSGAEAAPELYTRLALYLKQHASEKRNATIRLAVKIKRVNALAWLQAQKGFRRVYWRDREGSFEIAGLRFRKSSDLQSGVESIGRTHAARLLPNQPPLRALGAISFNAKVADDPFLPLPFGAPVIELATSGQDTFLICNVRWPGAFAPEALLDIYRDLLNRLVWEHLEQPFLPRFMARLDPQPREKWNEMISLALASIRAGDLQKVVLAREAICRFSQKVDPWHLLRKLRAANKNCYLFGIEEASEAFIGASPERLYRRVGRQIETEAVAGTRPRGATPEQDKLFADDLLNSEKDLREHRLVVTGIMEALKPLCDAMLVQPEPGILPLTRVQHLITRLQATLKPSVSDDELIAALHPTPAVGGYPKDKAMDLVKALEPFERGYYAAPVGWIAEDSTELAVGIRSAVIKDNAVRLYSGAGIVEGSDAESEWEEIEQKLSTFVSIMTAP